MRDAFADYKVYQPGERIVNVADSRNVKCTGIGNGKLLFCLPDGISKPVTIENVLHVPTCRNLLSMGQLMEKGLEIQIDPEKGCYLYKDDKLTGFAKMHKRLFLLDTVYMSKEIEEFEHVDKVILQKEKEMEKEKRLSAELWHRRLGHVSYRTIGSMENAVGGMRLMVGKGKSVANPKCEDCVKATISWKPFHLLRYPATKILECIHTDVCGLVEVMSLTSKRYFVLFTDKYTRYGTGYFMEWKSEVFSCFQEFHASVER